MRKNQLLFLAKFFAILLGGYLLVAWNPVNDRVIVPFTAVLSRIAGAILNFFGEGVTVTGTTIASPHFAVNVNNGCNGVEAMLILLAAMAAFPAGWKAKLIGLGIGALAIQILNEVRIVSLYLLGAHHPRLFQIFHTAVWQVAIILAAIGFFLYWSARVAPHRLANGT